MPFLDQIGLFATGSPVETDAAHIIKITTLKLSVTSFANIVAYLKKLQSNIAQRFRRIQVFGVGP